jgi:hypothetical protein
LGAAHGAEKLYASQTYVAGLTNIMYGSAVDLNSSTIVNALVCIDDTTSNCASGNGVTVPSNSSCSSDFAVRPCAATSNAFYFDLALTHIFGSINLIDGARHTVYTWALSSVGGSPVMSTDQGFSYQYVFGVSGLTWAAHLPAAPQRITAAQLGLLANSADPYSIGLAGATICMVGNTAIKDDGVVGYYALKRGIPCGNIRVVSLAVQQTVSQTILNSTILPAVAAMPATVQAIALGWVGPSYVSPVNSGYFLTSLGSAVMFGGLTTSGITGATNCQTFMNRGPVNPIFNVFTSTPYTTYNVRPTIFLAGEKCTVKSSGVPCTTDTYSTSITWSPDFPTFKAVIDAGLAAVDSNPVGAVAYNTYTANLTDSNINFAQSTLNAGNGLSSKISFSQLGTSASPNSGTPNLPNVIFYANAEPHWSVGSSWSVIPGAALAFGVTSSSGAMPQDLANQQTMETYWLTKGAVAAWGSGVEPCAAIGIKNPSVEIFVPFYAAGATMIQAMWAAVRLPWWGNPTGDPLAAPFSIASTSTRPPIVTNGGRRNH